MSGRAGNDREMHAYPGIPIRIVNGLDIPIEGAPEQAVHPGGEVRSVGLIGADYPGLRPHLLVKEGDRVRQGQTLFTDRRLSGVTFAAPGAGTVRRIERGARRALLSVVIELAGDDAESFSRWPADELAGLRRDQVTENLSASGMWTVFRARPYGKVPDPSAEPAAIFVTAIDTAPLAAQPDVIIADRAEDFANGLTVIARLTDGPVHVCTRPGTALPAGRGERIAVTEFAGPHPAGLPGTHIHFLCPVSENRTVWHLGYQDVIAIGALFTTGRLDCERVVALAGPQVERPRLVRTRLGASTDDLTQGELKPGDRRIVSGSVLSGRAASGAQGYLGRYDTQVSVIAEAPPALRGFRPFARLKDGFSAYGWARRQAPAVPRVAPTTALHGGATAMIPMEAFERVMPLDILPALLLRALLVGDTDMARALGCLELDEEDLALCSYVCPGKNDYGPLLRSCLDTIERLG